MANSWDPPITVSRDVKSGVQPSIHLGRVLDSDHRPVAGATVVAVSSPMPMPEIAHLADADGSFRIALWPGQTVLCANATVGVGKVEVTAPTSTEIVIHLSSDIGGKP